MSIKKEVTRNRMNLIPRYPVKPIFESRLCGKLCNNAL